MKISSCPCISHLAKPGVLLQRMVCTITRQCILFSPSRCVNPGEIRPGEINALPETPAYTMSTRNVFVSYHFAPASEDLHDKHRYGRNAGDKCRKRSIQACEYSLKMRVPCISNIIINV